MKRFFTVALSIGLLLLTACTPELPDEQEEEGGKDPVEISLCVFPVGGWSNKSAVSNMLTRFHNEYPNIHVNLLSVDYSTGDSEVENMIKEGNAPDIVFEGPERLVANWGARGLMADLNDLWEEEPAGEIYDRVRRASHNAEGDYLIYPVCMTTHCMAINRDLFEQTGAWQYVNEETHTWSTENFIKAVEKLSEAGVEKVGRLYCNGQSGDQGTRALINNLYSGTFTDEAHTRYTVNSPENIHALEVLTSLEGIKIDSTMNASDEMNSFASGELAMSFCWNVSAEVDQARNGNLAFDVFPMAFPTDDANFELQGGIWGFGIFDSGEKKRTEAAKTFIRYFTSDEGCYETAVLTSNFWAVRDMPDLYVNDRLMNEYGIFSGHMGDYYQVTPGWADARTAWWEMLQSIEKGTDIRTAVEEFSEKVN